MMRKVVFAANPLQKIPQVYVLQSFKASNVLEMMCIDSVVKNFPFIYAFSDEFLRGEQTDGAL